MKLIKWDVDSLEKATLAILHNGAKYDHSSLILSPKDLATLLYSIQDQVFALGDGGVAFFNPLIYGFHGTCHIYLWDPQFFRRIDLIKATLSWAFKNWDLTRIQCAIPSRNTLPHRLATKLGFKREGVMRDFVRYNGGVDDAILYGLLPGEAG